jgi:hypothetical protein
VEEQIVKIIKHAYTSAAIGKEKTAFDTLKVNK